MIASKVMCDDTYSNKSWGIVAQGMFTLREMNQMEREMCNYLEWELNVDTKTLKSFEMMVKKDFNGPGPYPTYVLSMFSKRADPSETAQPFTSSTSPIPSFGHGPPKESSPPPKPLQHQPHHPHMPLPPTRNGAYSPSTPRYAVQRNNPELVARPIRSAVYTDQSGRLFNQDRIGHLDAGVHDDHR